MYMKSANVLQELLKAAKQQDVRAAADRVRSTPAPKHNLAQSRLDAATIIRKSIERLNRKDPKYKSEGSWRGRSQSLSSSARGKAAEPSKGNSNTAPAVLVSQSSNTATAVVSQSPTVVSQSPAVVCQSPATASQADDTQANCQPVAAHKTKPHQEIPAEGPSGVSDNAMGSSHSPVQSDLLPHESHSRSTPTNVSKSDGSSSSSTDSSTDRPTSKRHKFGNKAHDLFQKLHLKLSTNKA